MTNISFKIDTNEKMMFQNICEDVGMNVSTVLDMFIKNVIVNKKLPFKVEQDPFYSKENVKRLNKAIKEAKMGKNMSYHELIED